ncbi:MAG: aminotransferase class IV [Deltaproteobacteria bacterium]|nr:aminotransferase class IV [Deltaproteobacteria bacterium]
MVEIVHIDGKPVKEESPLRSLMYGEGLFETFRWKSKPPVYYDRHIDRMRDGARVLGIPFPKDQEIEDNLLLAISESGISDAYVKISLLSKGSSVFYKEPRGYSLLLVVRRYQAPRESLSAKVSSFRRSSSSPILRIKSLNYLENLLAKREALCSGYDEAIFLNESDELAEGTVSNIFFIKGKVIYTPSLECGLLSGIIRGVIVQITNEFGFELKEGRYKVDELKCSQGVFLTNSLIGAVAMSSIDGVNLPCDCDIFHKLAKALADNLDW